MGQHDILIVLEAPDGETATKGVLAVGKLGNVRTTTMRAFSADEMQAVTSGL